MSAAGRLRVWSRRLLGWVQERIGRWTSWRRPLPARPVDAWSGLAALLEREDGEQRALAARAVERTSRSLPEGFHAHGLVTGERSSAAEVLLCLLREDRRQEVPHEDDEWIAWNDRRD